MKNEANLVEHVAMENATCASVRKIVLERDNYQCQVCGTTGDNRIQLHHWRDFRSMGGGDTADNLVTVCYADHQQIHLHNIDIALHEVSGKWYAFVRRAHRGTRV
jgi:5-methylcytosine-specific restriction endonuclease McrA